MAKSLGTLIKEARTAAGLSQAKLAEQITGLTASDTSKTERDEKEPTKEQIRQIAKALGVTQASLLSAVTGAGKAGSAKTSAAKKTSSKKTSGSTKASGKSGSLTLTATEKKLVELYREADSDTKKSVMKLLKGEQTEAGELVSQLLTSAMTVLGKK